MKKIISIITALVMCLAVFAFATSAAGALPEGPNDTTVYHIDDTTFAKIVEVDSGEQITNDVMSAAANGGCVGTDGCVQVWHNAEAGHLSSDNSVSLTPGAKIVITFEGVGVYLGANFRDMNPAGIVVTVDGVEVENAFAANECSANFDGDHVVPTVVAGVEGLEKGQHTVEFVSTTATRLSADWYAIMTDVLVGDDTTTGDETVLDSEVVSGDDTVVTEPGTETEGPVEPDNGANVVLIIGVIAAVLAVVCIAVFLIVKGKKHINEVK